jgi:hypothetical protein
MRLFRTGDESAAVAALDDELRDVVTRLRGTPDRDVAERERFRARIDELLDRRLELHDQTVIRNIEHLMSSS